MSKFLTASLVGVLLGASAATAEAGCGSCAAGCASACTAPAPQSTAQAPQATARAPQSTRSFSYQPSPSGTYRSMPRSRTRSSFGPRDASSKALGQY